MSDALKVSFRDADGLGHRVLIEEWQGGDPAEAGVRFESVRPAQDALNRLSYRCFPSYRPLLVTTSAC